MLMLFLAGCSLQKFSLGGCITNEDCSRFGFGAICILDQADLSEEGFCQDLTPDSVPAGCESNPSDVFYNLASYDQATTVGAIVGDQDSAYAEGYSFGLGEIAEQAGDSFPIVEITCDDSELSSVMKFLLDDLTVKTLFVNTEAGEAEDIASEVGDAAVIFSPDIATADLLGNVDPNFTDSNPGAIWSGNDRYVAEAAAFLSVLDDFQADQTLLYVPTAENLDVSFARALEREDETIDILEWSGGSLDLGTPPDVLAFISTDVVNIAAFRDMLDSLDAPGFQGTLVLAHPGAWFDDWPSDMSYSVQGTTWPRIVEKRVEQSDFKPAYFEACTDESPEDLEHCYAAAMGYDFAWLNVFGLLGERMESDQGVSGFLRDHLVSDSSSSTTAHVIPLSNTAWANTLDHILNEDDTFTFVGWGSDLNFESETQNLLVSVTGWRVNNTGEVEAFSLDTE